MFRWVIAFCRKKGAFFEVRKPVIKGKVEAKKVPTGKDKKRRAPKKMTAKEKRAREMARKALMKARMQAKKMLAAGKKMSAAVSLASYVTVQQIGDFASRFLPN